MQDQRIRWSPEEYKAIGLALLPEFPDKTMVEAIQVASGAQMTRAMRKALPKDRWRNILRYKFIAFATKALTQDEPKAKKPSPRGKDKKERVYWTPTEWEQLAQHILKKYPQYREDPSLKRFSISVLKVAQKELLPKHRHRALKNTSSAAAQLSMAIRALLKDSNQVALLDAAPAPVLKTYDKTDTRTQWSIGEWNAVVKALYQVVPKHYKMLEPANFSRIELADVQSAMRRALPDHRHRPIRAMAQLKRLLVPAIARVKPEIELEAAQKAQQSAEKKVERTLEEASAERKKIEAELLEAKRKAAAIEAQSKQEGEHFVKVLESAEIRHPAELMRPVTQAPVAVPERAIVSPAIVNPYERAFAPLLRPFIDLIASEVTKSILPTITGQLASQAAPAAAPLFAGFSLQELVQELAPAIAVLLEPTERQAPAPAAPVMKTAPAASPVPVAPVAVAAPVAAFARTDESEIEPIPANISHESRLNFPSQAVKEHVPVKLRYPKVGIAGMLPNQVEMLEDEFADRIDLISEKAESTRCVAAFTSCQKILCTKFPPKNVRDRLIHLYKDKLIYIDGGYSSVKAKISEMLKKGELEVQPA
jgi:hypothetical protein